MYELQPFDVVDRLIELQAIAESIDLTRGAASYITSTADTLPKFQPVLADVFAGTWTGAGLIVLQASQQLVAHSDPPIKGVRYHIPLWTNNMCYSFSDGIWQQFREGYIYKMNPTVIHGAVNWGASRRLHLMVDLDV